VDSVPTFPRSPTQEEIDERMRVLNEVVRQLDAVQEGDAKVHAERSLKEVYDWLVMRRINFYFDRGTDTFRVIDEL